MKVRSLDGYVLLSQCQFTLDLVKNLLQKINFTTLLSALRDLQLNESFISILEEKKDSKEDLVNFILESEQLLKDLHHILFEYHVVNGILICPTTGREFIVKDGIPNMLLHEDEVQKVLCIVYKL